MTLGAQCASGVVAVGGTEATSLFNWTQGGADHRWQYNKRNPVSEALTKKLAAQRTRGARALRYQTRDVSMCL